MWVKELNIKRFAGAAQAFNLRVRCEYDCPSLALKLQETLHQIQNKVTI